MEKKILYISSCRECIVEKLSLMLRELGKRTKRPLWGKSFSPDEEAKALLYLDSGGRGNISMMAKSMGADIIKYVFCDYISGKSHILLSEMLKKEYKDGECFYKREKIARDALGKHIRALDLSGKVNNFFVVNELPAEKSPVYSAIKSEVKKNVTEGSFTEGELALILEDEIPDVIICDPFLSGGAFAVLEKLFGKPKAIHIMNKSNHIYAPYTSLEKEIFIETEEYIKEALFAVCLWLRDNAEIRAEGKLLSAFSSLSRGENLIERTVNAFMRAEKRKRRIVKNEHKNKT